MKTNEKSAEVRAFNVTQECGFISCNGNYKSIDLFYNEKASYVHECTECKELKLFEKEYPRLEYEEVEKKPTVASDPEVEGWDDDIPF